jgi:hypothetical protein
MYSNFNVMRNRWLFQKQDVPVAQPQTPAQQEESQRLAEEDQCENWLQDEAPLPF